MSQSGQSLGEGLQFVQSPNADNCEKEAETYQISYDPAVTETSYAVIAAVGAICQTEPLELDPLYSAIDPDKLDKLICGTEDDREATFQYSGFEITVKSAGEITCRRDVTGE